tara:strand:- start:3339 stop:3533 length:195 start_codon:yes stop_codon:yes gene_type:complete
MTKKITIHDLSNLHDEELEKEFGEVMAKCILATGVCPESSVRMMDRCYRTEFELPMDLVYAQFL